MAKWVVHKFGGTSLADVVRGPGAGSAVTAAGVSADLLRLTTFLGATLPGAPL